MIHWVEEFRTDFFLFSRHVALFRSEFLHISLVSLRDTKLDCGTAAWLYSGNKKAEKPINSQRQSIYCSICRLIDWLMVDCCKPNKKQSINEASYQVMQMQRASLFWSLFLWSAISSVSCKKYFQIIKLNYCTFTRINTKEAEGKRERKNKHVKQPLLAWRWRHAAVDGKWMQICKSSPVSGDCFLLFRGTLSHFSWKKPALIHRNFSK